MHTFFDTLDADINAFLSNHSQAVLATVDESTLPSTSTIYYVLHKRNKIHFMTKSETVKYKNLIKNPHVAMTILDKQLPIAVNLQGVVSEVTDNDERDRTIQEVVKYSYSELHDFAPIVKLHKGSFTVFSFTPENAVLTDFTKPMGEAKERKKEY